MKSRTFALCLCVLFSVQSPLFAGLSWDNLGLPSDLFPVSSEYHKINSVREDPAIPGSLIFTVSSADGIVEVEGLVALKKWIHEAAVIAELKKKGTSSGVVDGAAESIKGTGRGLMNMVFHPINSAKGIGKAAGELGNKVGGAFDKKEEGEKGDTFLSSSKRQIAKKLGVDVYSRNQELQDQLGTLAKRQMGGRGAVFVVNFLIPVGLIASAVMTVSSVNNAADELVDDKDRGDLYALNKDSLLHLGFALPKIIAFLNHPYYTPRELTYIRFYIEKLSPLHGSKALLDEATRLVGAVPAQKFLHEMQIAADAMGFMKDAVAVQIVPEGLILERSDSIVLITDYDYLSASSLGSRVIKTMLEAKVKLGKRSAEIWNGGVVTTGFGGELIFKGVKTRRMCLFQNSGKTETSE